MSDNKPRRYSELGKVLDDLARERDVRGPYNIANHVKNATGYEASGQVLSKYLYGEYVPKREFVSAFAEAFELNVQERGELAWVYAYDSRPELERVMIVERKRASDTRVTEYVS